MIYAAYGFLAVVFFTGTWVVGSWVGDQFVAGMVRFIDWRRSKRDE